MTIRFVLGVGRVWDARVRENTRCVVLLPHIYGVFCWVVHRGSAGVISRGPESIALEISCLVFIYHGGP